MTVQKVGISNISRQRPNKEGKSNETLKIPIYVVRWFGLDASRGLLAWVDQLPVGGLASRPVNHMATEPQGHILSPYMVLALSPRGSSLSLLTHCTHHS